MCSCTVARGSRRYRSNCFLAPLLPVVGSRTCVDNCYMTNCMSGLQFAMNVNSLTAVRDVDESSPCNGMADANSFAVALLPGVATGVALCNTQRFSEESTSSWLFLAPKPLLVLGISRPKKCSVSLVYRLFRSATRKKWLRIVFVFRRQIGSPDQCPKRLQSKQRVTSFF